VGKNLRGAGNKFNEFEELPPTKARLFLFAPP